MGDVPFRPAPAARDGWCVSGKRCSARSTITPTQRGLSRKHVRDACARIEAAAGRLPRPGHRPDPGARSEDGDVGDGRAEVAGAGVLILSTSGGARNGSRGAMPNGRARTTCRRQPGTADSSLLDQQQVRKRSTPPLRRDSGWSTTTATHAGLRACSATRQRRRKASRPGRGWHAEATWFAAAACAARTSEPAARFTALTAGGYRGDACRQHGHRLVACLLRCVQRCLLRATSVLAMLILENLAAALDVLARRPRRCHAVARASKGRRSLRDLSLSQHLRVRPARCRLGGMADTRRPPRPRRWSCMALVVIDRTPIAASPVPAVLCGGACARPAAWSPGLPSQVRILPDRQSGR